MAMHMGTMGMHVPPMMIPGQQMTMVMGTGMSGGIPVPAQMDGENHTADLSTGTKRPREDELMSAEDFAALIPSGLAKVDVTVASDSSHSTFNLNGQTVPLELDVFSTIKQLKELLSTHLGGMPANKMQLKSKSGFLKDAQSLAAANIGLGVVLELSMKTRGGKR